MLVGTVAEAWRYPIKSLAGLRAPTLDLDARGVIGDRALAVYGADGKIGSGKATRRFRRMDGLLECSTNIEADGTITLRTPAGDICPAPSPEANAALSRLLGEPVELRPEEAVAHFDVGPLHILTTSSLEWVAQRLGAPVSTSRFRPNLVVSTPGAAPHSEDGWVGRQLALGSAILEITEPTERCVMVNLAQPGLPTDERILRLLAREHDACLGVYASVVAPGRIGVGDAVEVLA